MINCLCKTAIVVALSAAGAAASSRPSGLEPAIVDASASFEIRAYVFGASVTMVSLVALAIQAGATSGLAWSRRSSGGGNRTVSRKRCSVMLWFRIQISTLLG